MKGGELIGGIVLTPLCLEVRCDWNSPTHERRSSYKGRENLCTESASEKMRRVIDEKDIECGSSSEDFE